MDFEIPAMPKAASFSVVPIMIGTELNSFLRINSLGSSGKNGDSLSASIRGEKANGYISKVYKFKKFKNQ